MRRDLVSVQPQLTPRHGLIDPEMNPRSSRFEPDVHRMGNIRLSALVLSDGTLPWTGDSRGHDPLRVTRKSTEAKGGRRLQFWERSSVRTTFSVEDAGRHVVTLQLGRQVGNLFCAQEKQERLEAPGQYMRRRIVCTRSKRLQPVETIRSSHCS